MTTVNVRGGNPKVVVQDLFPSIDTEVERCLCSDARVSVHRIAATVRLVIAQVAAEQSLHGKVAKSTLSTDARTAATECARNYYRSLKRRERLLQAQVSKLGSYDNHGANEWAVHAQMRDSITGGDPHVFVEGATAGLKNHCLNTAQILASIRVAADEQKYAQHTLHTHALSYLIEGRASAAHRPAEVMEQISQRQDRIELERGGAGDGLHKTVAFIPLSRSALFEAYGVHAATNPLLSDTLSPEAGSSAPMLVMVFNENGSLVKLQGEQTFVGLTSSGAALAKDIMLADGVEVERGERSTVQLLVHELEPEFSAA